MRLHSATVCITCIVHMRYDIPCESVSRGNIKWITFNKFIADTQKIIVLLLLIRSLSLCLFRVNWFIFWQHEKGNNIRAKQINKFIVLIVAEWRDRTQQPADDDNNKMHLWVLSESVSFAVLFWLAPNSNKKQDDVVIFVCALKKQF